MELYKIEAVKAKTLSEEKNDYSHRDMAFSQTSIVLQFASRQNKQSMVLDYTSTALLLVSFNGMGCGG